MLDNAGKHGNAGLHTKSDNAHGTLPMLVNIMHIDVVCGKINADNVSLCILSPLKLVNQAR